MRCEGRWRWGSHLGRGEVHQGLVGGIREVQRAYNVFKYDICLTHTFTKDEFFLNSELKY